MKTKYKRRKIIAARALKTSRIVAQRRNKDDMDEVDDNAPIINMLWRKKEIGSVYFYQILVIIPF